MRREPDVCTILSQFEIGHFMLVLQSLNEFSDGQIFTTVCLLSILRCVWDYVPLLRAGTNDDQSMRIFRKTINEPPKFPPKNVYCFREEINNKKHPNNFEMSFSISICRKGVKWTVRDFGNIK